MVLTDTKLSLMDSKKRDLSMLLKANLKKIWFIDLKFKMEEYYLDAKEYKWPMIFLNENTIYWIILRKVWT